MPKSVIKMNKKDGVTFTSNVNAAEYLLAELSRGALRDVGKFVKKETRKNIKRKTGRLAKNVQHWVPPIGHSKASMRELHLEVGFKPGGFYGMFQEIGTKKTPKVGALYHAAADNIAMIIKIESQYLSALSSEAKALSLIDESEEVGDE